LLEKLRAATYRAPKGKREKAEKFVPYK